MSAFSIAWIVIVGAGLILEVIALLRKQRADTASEHVWALLRKSVFGWFLAAGLLLWVTVHFLSFGRVDDWIRGW